MEYFSLVKPPFSRSLKAGKVVLESGESVGEHLTENKEEIIIVQKGTATIRAGKETVVLEKGKTYFIPENTVHNVTNNSETVLEYFFIVSLFEKK